MTAGRAVRSAERICSVAPACPRPPTGPRVSIPRSAPNFVGLSLSLPDATLLPAKSSSVPKMLNRHMKATFPLVLGFVPAARWVIGRFTSILGHLVPSGPSKFETAALPCLSWASMVFLPLGAAANDLTSPPSLPPLGLSPIQPHSRPPWCCCLCLIPRPHPLCPWVK